MIYFFKLVKLLYIYIVQRKIPEFCM